MAIYCAIKEIEALDRVINRIVWDGTSPYTYPDPAVSLVQSDIGQIDDKYENGKFYYWDEYHSGGPIWVERDGQ